MYEQDTTSYYYHRKSWRTNTDRIGKQCMETGQWLCGIGVTSLDHSILLRSCFVAARTFRIFPTSFLTVARLTAVDARDTTAAAACYTRREHVSAINNNIMSYMVLYYYNYTEIVPRLNSFLK